MGLALLVGGAVCGSVRGQSPPTGRPPDTLPDNPEKPPTPLEFWHDGKDALSDRLADAVYTALAHCADFIPSSGKQPGSLLVEIPANVNGRQVGKRTRVSYTVTYSTADGHAIGTSTGSCWGDQLDVCANQIVKHAQVAALKVK